MGDLEKQIVQTLRHWQAFRFSEDPEESRAFILRANDIVEAAHKRNAAHVKLYTLTIFIAIEAGNFTSAREMLRGFLKQEHPDWTPDQIQAELRRRIHGST